MSLQSRTANFDILASRFKCVRPSPLFLIHQIEESLFSALQTAAAVYLSKCLGSRRYMLGEEEVMEEFVTHRSTIRNVTPNGMVVPKRHLVLEFNLLVKAFSDIIQSIKIQDRISSWHVPLNLRYKDGEALKENLVRRYATEHIHSDSWAGESAESVTVMIPIFGDIDRNHMLFYEPPADFDEAWLGPRGSYSEGTSLIGNYKQIALKQKKGHLYLSDFATLHSSSRLPGAGPRVSIDTTFAIKRLEAADGKTEVIHPWRIEERMDPQALANIGSTHLMYFPDSLEEQVDVSQGLKHPTRLKIVDFTEK